MKTNEYVNAELAAQRAFPTETQPVVVASFKEGYCEAVKDVVKLLDVLAIDGVKEVKEMIDNELNDIRNN